MVLSSADRDFCGGDDLDDLGSPAVLWQDKSRGALCLTNGSILVCVVKEPLRGNAVKESLLLEELCFCLIFFMVAISNMATGHEIYVCMPKQRGKTNTIIL